MTIWQGFTRQRIDVPCRLEVEHSFESLHAHLELGEGVEVYPGDEVLVHGEPVIVPFGETRVLERSATVVRATWLERLWTRLTGDLEVMELYEFSFSSGRKL